MLVVVVISDPSCRQAVGSHGLEGTGAKFSAAGGSMVGTQAGHAQGEGSGVLADGDRTGGRLRGKAQGAARCGQGDVSHERLQSNRS
jgi:hypothetical protein